MLLLTLESRVVECLNSRLSEGFCLVPASGIIEVALHYYYYIWYMYFVL